jgi:hypothetical protein
MILTEFMTQSIHSSTLIITNPTFFVIPIASVGYHGYVIDNVAAKNNSMMSLLSFVYSIRMSLLWNQSGHESRNTSQEWNHSLATHQGVN